MPILPTERDPRLITVRRGGTLTDGHHRMLAEWAAARLRERDRQREQVPAELLDLVLEDQRHRSAICWHVFDD
ncbi:MAG: hypothetical protein ACRDQ0_16580 [Pseudonocardia sp.]